MAQNSRFFDNVNYTEADFAEVQNRLLPEGVILGVGGEFSVAAPGGMFVQVQTGEVMIQGFWGQNTAAINLAIGANSSGSTRTDNIVLRLNRVTNGITLAVVPNAPSPTRTPGGDWEVVIASVQVPNNAGAIATGNIIDQRQSVNCGYTGIGGVARTGGSRAVMGFAPATDRDTGIWWPAANQFELVAGGSVIVTAQQAFIGIGSDPAITGFTLGRAGLTIGVAGDFSVLGNLGVTGTFTVNNNAAITGSLGLPAIIPTSGTLTLQSFGPALALNFSGPAFQMISMGDAGATKQMVFMFSMANGQGLGNAGDVSLYTAGPAAGWVRIGTNSQNRIQISPTGSHSYNGSLFNYFSSANDIGSGIRLFHTNTAIFTDFFNASNGTTIFANTGIGTIWMGNGRASFGGELLTGSAGRVTIQQQSAAATEGFVAVYGGAILQMFSDGTGDSHLRSAGTFVTLNYGQAAFTPFTDQGAYLGLAGRRWAVVYTAGLVVYAGAVFAGALSGITNIAMSGGISGMTTLSMSGGISGATTGTFSATVSAANFSTSGAVSAGSVTAAFHYASLRVLPTSDNVAAVGQSGTMFSEMWTYNGYKPGGGSWTATSDDRAKMDTFKPFDDGLDTILRLDPVLYTYNGLYGMPKGSEHVGFRAQELQEIVPEMVGMVRAKRTGADDEPYEDVLTVDTTRLEYMLVNAVKELHAEIERLKSQLAERTN